MDIYKFSLTLKQEDYEAMVIVDSINSKRKKNIQEKDGYLAMADLPHDCIFNKVRTGCGGTTIALQNEENYVIAVPTTELIINKLNSTTNLFGLYGDFAFIKKDLIRYTKRNGVKKIMCTYDKLPKLVEVVDTMEYRLVVDEYHNLLKQYMFRTTAINGVFDNFRKFKSFYDHNLYIAFREQLLFDIFLKAKKLLLLDQLFTYNIYFDAVAHFVGSNLLYLNLLAETFQNSL